MFGGCRAFNKAWEYKAWEFRDVQGLAVLKGLVQESKSFCLAIPIPFTKQKTCISLPQHCSLQRSTETDTERNMNQLERDQKIDWRALSFLYGSSFTREGRVAIRPETLRTSDLKS